MTVYGHEQYKQKVLAATQRSTPEANARDIPLDFVTVRYSRAELDKMADEVIAAAAVQGIKGYVRTDGRTGSMTFVPDGNISRGVNAPSSSTKTAGIKLPYDTPVGTGPAIVKNAITWSGGQYLNRSGGACTTGFVGYNNMRGTIERGAITAYHCGGAGSRQAMDAYNANYTYQNPSSLSAFVREYGYSIEQDFMFMRFEDQANNGTRAYFFTGQGAAVVRGAVDVAWNSYVCKFGRNTGQTCGTVGYSTVREGNGTYYIVTGSSRMTIGGDSGGPVYQGNLIAGIVYAEYGYNGMLVNPYAYISAKTNNIKFTCEC